MAPLASKTCALIEIPLAVEAVFPRDDKAPVGQPGDGGLYSRISTHEEFVTDLCTRGVEQLRLDRGASLLPRDDKATIV